MDSLLIFMFIALSYFLSTQFFDNGTNKLKLADLVQINSVRRVAAKKIC